MTNNNNNPKIILLHRFFLVLVFGAALLSLYLLGTAHDENDGRIISRTYHQSEPVLGPDVLYSPFLMDSHAVSALRELQVMHDQTTTAAALGPFHLRAPVVMPQPHFSIDETDQAVTVTVQVPETLKMEDIDVQVREGGSILHIQGGHRTTHSQVNFEKTFALGRHMDTDSITASLSNKGVLTVTAPKLVKKQVDTIRKIDITKTEF